jgi:hypothetical protein
MRAIHSWRSVLGTPLAMILAIAVHLIREGQKWW